MRNRAAFAIGAALILMGVLLLVNTFIPTSWPLIFLAIGGVLAFTALAGRVPGLWIPATIHSMLGLIFLWQVNLGDYTSWLYVWPLIPGSVGLGMLIAGWVGMPGKRARWFGSVFFLEGLAFTAFGWWLNTQGWMSWPLIPAGLGWMFLLAAVLTRSGGLAIPGTIIGGLGAILYWQNSSNTWTSWSYVWTLVPGLVGLGFLLANLFGLRSRHLRVIGSYFVFWSLLFFAIFAAFFGDDIFILRFWPVLIVASGIWLLVRAFTNRAK